MTSPVALARTPGPAVAAGLRMERDVQRFLDRTSCVPLEGAQVVERELPGCEPAWIFFNGVPASGAVWAPLVEALRTHLRNRLLVVDLPGTGGSRIRSGPSTWSRQRALVAEYLARRPAAVLVVHDIAGPVVLPLLGRRTATRGVAVFNTIARPSVFEPLAAMRLLQLPVLGTLAARATTGWLYAAGLRRFGLAHPERVAGSLVRRLFEECFGGGRWKQLSETMRGFELDVPTDEALERGLRSAAGRPLVLWARGDPSLADQTAMLIAPGRDVEVLPEARHFAMLDHAAQAADALCRWGQRCGTATATGVNR